MTIHGIFYRDPHLIAVKLLLVLLNHLEEAQSKAAALEVA